MSQNRNRTIPIALVPEGTDGWAPAKLTAGLDPFIRAARPLIALHGYEWAIAALDAQLGRQRPAVLSGLAAVAISQLATQPLPQTPANPGGRKSSETKDDR